MELPILENVDTLTMISTHANKEKELQEALNEIEKLWINNIFEIKQYKEDNKDF